MFFIKIRHSIFIRAMHRIIRQIIVVFNNLVDFIIIFNPLFKASLNLEYSCLAPPSTPGLYSKSSPAKYSYLSNTLGDNAEILTDALSKSY